MTNPQSSRWRKIAEVDEVLALARSGGAQGQLNEPNLDLAGLAEQRKQ